MASLFNVLLNSVFGDPVIRDVDDDDLPLPEHRINVLSSAIHDEPERKRLRAEGYLPAIVCAAMDHGGSSPIVNPIPRTRDDQKTGLVLLTSSRIATLMADQRKSGGTKNGTRSAVSSEEYVVEEEVQTPAIVIGSKRGRSSSTAVASPMAAAAPSPKASRAKSASKGRASSKKAHPHDDEHEETADTEPSELWTVAEMRSYASTNQIELSGVTRKTDILDKLLEARSI